MIIMSKKPKKTRYNLKRKLGMTLGKITRYNLMSGIMQLICNINIKCDGYKKETVSHFYVYSGGLHG